MKRINTTKIAVAALLGIGVLGSLAPAEARPNDRRDRDRHERRDRDRDRDRYDRRDRDRHDRRPDYRRPNYRDSDRSDYRRFNGRAVADNRSGSLMKVRADNGTTYTVRSRANVRRGERVSVSGYLRNGIIENATVNRY